ncbi:MAG: GntR family transcriptional regulator [Planctomycetaceae bacterium]|nr:GntR family transcriptional regulator [Planctomycetaceae bacterium]
MRTLTLDQETRLDRLVRHSRLSEREIAAAAGVSRETVRKHKAAAGCNRQSGRCQCPTCRAKHASRGASA